MSTSAWLATYSGKIRPGVKGGRKRKGWDSQPTGRSSRWRMSMSLSRRNLRCRLFLTKFSRKSKWMMTASVSVDFLKAPRPRLRIPPRYHIVNRKRSLPSPGKRSSTALRARTALSPFGANPTSNSGKYATIGMVRFEAQWDRDDWFTHGGMRWLVRSRSGDFDRLQ